MKRWPGFVTPGFLALAGLLVAGCGAELGRSSDPGRTAQAYVEGYNHRDGEAICARSTTELRRWFQQLAGHRSLQCASIAAASIGYGEESDTPTFRHLEVLAVVPHVSGDRARVEVKARYRYKGYPKFMTKVFTDELYLFKRQGLWKVGKPGGVYFATRSAYNWPDNALDPPLTNSGAHRPAPKIRADFPCLARGAMSADDPRGDSPRPLDVRRIATSVNEDGAICLQLLFVEAPRPGTEIAFRITQPKGNRQSLFRVFEPSIRIGSRGHFRVSMPGRRSGSRFFEAGWRGDRLEILWRRHRGSSDDARMFRLFGTTSTLQAWEPLIRHPLLGGGDDPRYGLGDEFEVKGQLTSASRRASAR